MNPSAVGRKPEIQNIKHQTKNTEHETNMSSPRLESLLQFLEKDPNDSFTRYAIALEYVSEGNTEQGIAYLEDLLERDPGYVATYLQLGYLYTESERKEDALAILKRGIEIARQSGDLHAASEMQDAVDELGY